MHTQFLLENLKGRIHLRYLCVTESIILKRTLRTQCGRIWVDLSVSGYDSMVGCCEHGDEPLGSINGRGYCRLYRNDCSMDSGYLQIILNVMERCWALVAP
jgi:hypothetical protein